MKNKKHIIIPIVILIVAGLISFLVVKGYLLNKNNNTVATVNGEKIEQQVFQITKQQLSQIQDLQITDQQIIDKIIDNELLIQEAKNQGFKIDNQEIDNQYQNLVTQAGGEEIFNKGLNELNISEKYVKNDIENQLLVQQYIDDQSEEKDFPVTDEEINTFYNQLSSQQEGAPSFEDIKDQIKDQISQQKLNEFILNIVANLREKADINISL